MTSDDYRSIAASGLSDALRRSPVVFGLAFVLGVEALAIAGLAWISLDRGAQERERVAQLTSQLVDCHKNGTQRR